MNHDESLLLPSVFPVLGHHSIRKEAESRTNYDFLRAIFITELAANVSTKSFCTSLISEGCPKETTLSRLKTAATSHIPQGKQQAIWAPFNPSAKTLLPTLVSRIVTPSIYIYIHIHNCGLLSSSAWLPLEPPQGRKKPRKIIVPGILR